MDTHFFNISLRVLICPEDGEFVARALEMDIVGYGKTQTEAVEDLKGAIEAQISFAHQMGDVSLIGFPADKEYFDRWEQAQTKALRSEILGDKSVKLQAKAIAISFTQADLARLRTRRFRQQENLVCA